MLARNKRQTNTDINVVRIALLYVPPKGAPKVLVSKEHQCTKYKNACYKLIGGVEEKFDQSHLDAMFREFKEETGGTLSPEEFLEFVYHDDIFRVYKKDIHRRTYLAITTKRPEINLGFSSDEIMSLHWLSLGHLPIERRKNKKWPQVPLVYSNVAQLAGVLHAHWPLMRKYGIEAQASAFCKQAFMNAYY